MFNKSKNTKPAPKAEEVNVPVSEFDQDRNSVLSGWGAPMEAFSETKFSQDRSATTASIKKGYKICAKCLAVVPATDSKCSSCGFIKK